MMKYTASKVTIVSNDLYVFKGHHCVPLGLAIQWDQGALKPPFRL